MRIKNDTTLFEKIDGYKRMAKCTTCGKKVVMKKVSHKLCDGCAKNRR